MKKGVLKRICAFTLSSMFILSAATSADGSDIASNDEVGETELNLQNKVETNENRKMYSVTENSDGTTTYYVVTNPNGGELLTFSKDGGIKILERKDGEYTYAFKDMNKNGVLDDFEDWRKDPETRSKDLAKKLTKEQIAGLMLFSSHEFNIAAGLTEKQMNYLKNDHLRNVLNAAGNEVEDAVKWNNQMQAYVESIGEK